MLKRFRFWGLWGSSAAVVSLLWWTDPDGGQSTGLMLLGLWACIIAVGIAHLSRKALFDYLNLQQVADEARQSPTGAGLVFLGACIVIAALLLLVGRGVHAETLDVRSFIPAGASRYGPTLKAEQLRAWPADPLPSALAALVEQESCQSLTHPGCWNPKSRLRTAREEGAGFGQITRAFNRDGSVRFDALAETRRLDAGLSDWSWANVYDRPDLQLRALVVMNRQCYTQVSRFVTNEFDRLAFCDAAYNGGFGGMQADRRACGLKTGCDPQHWFGQVETTCTKSRRPLYGRRNACDINREHVDNVLHVRRPKYVALMRDPV